MQPVPIPLRLLLFTAVFSPATGDTKEGHRDCREESFGDWAHDVALKCSDPSFAHPLLVLWSWSDFSGVTKEVLLAKLLNGSVTKHEERAGAVLSAQTCVNIGDCTLTLNPRKEDAGFYHCVVWTNKRVTETKICLVYRAYFRTTYIVAGACGGVLLIAVVILLIFLRRRARNRARSLESRMHRENSVNREPVYVDLNLAERDVYSSLKL
ncbi:uncharacterized protein LOC127587220 isoform X2 [Pristis pectinata]|uniref:uncharacterized protein LOC127587220 isoform X2 n=1 Tax=Pristis pectinata TaxID=685728 RepID=UPI00223CC97B|nr:uncharacterized protein LOC127587220 isoform X2 [Pristis pectinata]